MRASLPYQHGQAKVGPDTKIKSRSREAMEQLRNNLADIKRRGHKGVTSPYDRKVFPE
jgi:hypothetical protein